MKNHLLTYGSFSEYEIDKIVNEYSEELTFKKRDYIVTAGEVSHYQYFILEGCMRGFIIDYQGKEHNIIFGFEDFWFGDMESFDSGKAAIYNFQALEPLKLLAISKENWDKISTEIPSFIAYKCKLFQNAMMFQQMRIAEHLTQSAEQRYYNLLQKYPDVIFRISLKNIASYLGISPEFVSILRKRAVQK
ncbi:Crp/Fnr family transcriptional regulator [Neptunitalea lumnitzerae]|uniref:Cyclic nucleotide-binding protein n=1 Tax=Neptunitalea lumnitzerae TaxID=2965509 RepID=A0ABQ5MGW0_9FLAO|nr:Crp/Fnr family transcriptional regulator [Neptunitalea sp. Y10]GLB48628.1 cyclic nucleotide-binding protein [Neptunitalea sp. Y10]